MHRLYKLFQMCALEPKIRQDLADALVRGKLVQAFRTARLVSQPRRTDVRSERIVSRRYRYVWLCNPKVASNSIKSALLSVTPDAEVFTSMSIGEFCEIRPDVRRYHSFSFVRHPYTRALSFYAQLFFSHETYPGSQWRRKHRNSLFNSHPGLSEITSFDEYCRWLATPYGSDAFADNHYLSQHLYIRLEDGRLPTFVGRLENLDQDLERVLRDLGLPKPKLPVLHTMAGWRPAPAELQAARAAMSELLTEDSKALLRMRYAKDFEVGGYTG